MRKPLVEEKEEEEAEDEETEDIQKTSMGYWDQEAYIFNTRFDNDPIVDSFDEF